MINTPSVDFHRLVVADNEQRPLYRGFPITEKTRDNFHFELQFPIQKFADGIYYKELLTDTVWKVNVDKQTPAYVLNFPKRGELFSPADRKNITDELYRQKTRSIAEFTGDFLIADQIVFFGVRSDDESMRSPLLYSKKTGKVISGNIADPETPSREDRFFNHYPQFVYQDTAFITILHSSMMTMIINRSCKGNHDNLSTRNKQLIESAHAEDNPVLMVVKYKEF